MNLSPFPRMAFALLLGSTAVLAQTNITVTDTGGVSRTSFPAHFYGANGQDRNNFDWNQAGFVTTLGTMNMGVLRFPAGTGANYWNFIPGTFISLYGGVNNPVSPMSELAQEITNTKTAVPLFVFNFISDPQADVLDGNGGPTVNLSNFSASSAPAKYQLDTTAGVFAYARSNSVSNFFRVELGNEIYGHGDCLTPFPDTATGGPGQLYATTANEWTQFLHTNNAGSLVAAVAADRSLKLSDSRRQIWNWGSNGASGLYGTLKYNTGTNKDVDASILHIYPEPNLAANAEPPIDGGVNGKAQQLFGSVFLNWRYIQSDDFGSSEAVPKTVWITEYNLDSQFQPTGQSYVTSSYYGTWAHGLSLAAMSLQWLEEKQIQMMVHHCVVAAAAYGDIYHAADDLSAVNMTNPSGWSTAPSTTQFGLSACGLVSQLINTAAIGQSTASQLIFSGFSNGPTYTVSNNTDGSGSIAVPRLYGWEFKGGANGDMAVIVNLDTSAYALNMGGFAKSGSYSEVYGDAAAYVTDGANHKAYDYTGGVDNLLTLSGSTASFTAKPFSITLVKLVHK